jgi:hypothetical protein
VETPARPFRSYTASLVACQAVNKLPQQGDGERLLNLNVV